MQLFNAYFRRALLLSLSLGGTSHGALAQDMNTRIGVVRPAVPLPIEPFDLADVKLLPSPFQEARDRDVAYLLRLEPDRLLHNFRTEAGLTAKAEIYGGWENAGVAGHILGHYLSALSMQLRSTGDVRLKTRLDYIVGELALCQEKNGGGYVSAIPGGKAIFADVAAGKGDAVQRGWVPWYTMHKLLAGLRDAAIFGGNAQAKTVLLKLSDWAIDTTRNLSDEEWQKMLQQEHGGMNEVMADVYALSGDKKYLDLARHFDHKAVTDPLARREDRLTNLHANTQIPKIIGAARLYELEGQERDKTIAEYFWDRVVHTRTYVIGGNSEHERFSGADNLKNRISPNTAETCNTYNMLKLTRHLFEWSGKAEYADYYERALYNHILASQEPDHGGVTYMVSLKPGHFKTYSTEFASFWCCVGTGLENHVKYNDSIYFHDQNNLYVNLFIPSQVNWKERGLVVKQETTFPDSDITKLTVSCAKPTSAALKVRTPAWAKSGISVSINGRAQKIIAHPGEYVTLARSWKNGDRVEIRLPMSLHTEALPGDPNQVAILYGPLVLAADLGHEGIVAPMPYASNQLEYVGARTPDVPVLMKQNGPLESWIRPVAAQPLTFVTKGAGRPNDVTLRPFNRIVYNRYNVYWDLFSEADWQTREAGYKAEKERIRAIEARTVDTVRIGEQQPEIDHKLQSERSGNGPGMEGLHWRDAADGGWFSYQMKVLPDAPQNLICTYWGSDAGRTFDILIDGKVIATETLKAERPGKYFDREIPIPTELTQGKSQITVRFQAKPGAIAGGVFVCTVVKRL